MLVAATMLASCRTPSFLCVKPSGLKSITIVTEPGTNDGLVPDIDLLFITDKDVMKRIEAMKLKAKDYFVQRDQILADAPGAIRRTELGLEAGQSDEIAVKPPCNLSGTLLFVNYNNDADNRFKLTKAKAGTLRLGASAAKWQKR